MENKTPLIIDNGSGVVKAGYSGEDAPCCIFPSIIGRPKYKNIMKNMINANNANITISNNIYIGEDAQAKRGILKLTYPIEHGIVMNWDDMEKIWEYTFNDQLNVKSNEHNVLLTEAPLNPIRNREQMLEIMFEKFNVPASFIALQGVLSLYASGRITGIVLDVGDGVSHTIPIYQGYNIASAINRYNLAGRDITTYLQRLLENRGIKLRTSSDKEIVRDIKEKLSYCSLDNLNHNIYNYNDYNDYNNYNDYNDMKEHLSEYMLPDGNIVTIGNELALATEILFYPALIGKELNGLQYAVHDSIQRTSIDIRRELYANVVLSGGTTMIRNFDAKLKKELKYINNVNYNNFNNSNNINIIAHSNRNYSVWLGGSILTSLPTFENSWIKKKEYEEIGVSIVHKKCM